MSAFLEPTWSGLLFTWTFAHVKEDDMTAMISLVALCALCADVSRQPTWHTDCQAALAQGSRHNRPLAVFLAPGRSGLDRLAPDSLLSGEVQQLLQRKYVPVF